MITTNMIQKTMLNSSNGDLFEIHYWLQNNSHSVDGNIENRCGYEVLGIIKEVARILNVEIIIETEPTLSASYLCCCLNH